ncbi:unnamed protein product, partial [Sphacelaria rigidula]
PAGPWRYVQPARNLCGMALSVLHRRASQDSSGTSGQDWNGERSGGEAGNVQPTIDASWEICIAPVEKEDGLATRDSSTSASPVERSLSGGRLGQHGPEETKEQASVGATAS